jgi:hypothetical protein
LNGAWAGRRTRKSKVKTHTLSSPACALKFQAGAWIETVVKLPEPLAKDGAVGYWRGFVLDCRLKVSTIPDGVDCAPLSAFRGRATEEFFLFSSSLPPRKRKGEKNVPKLWRIP